jgi:hypothetical protein
MSTELPVRGGWPANALRAGMQVFAFLGGSHAARQDHRSAIETMRPAQIFTDMRLLPELVKQPCTAAKVL